MYGDRPYKLQVKTSERIVGTWAAQEITTVLRQAVSILLYLTHTCRGGNDPRCSLASRARWLTASILRSPFFCFLFGIHTLPHLPTFLFFPSTTTLWLLVYRLPTSWSGGPSGSPPFTSLGAIGCVRRCYSPLKSSVQLSHCSCTIFNTIPVRHSLLQYLPSVRPIIEPSPVARSLLLIRISILIFILQLFLTDSRPCTHNSSTTRTPTAV